MLQPCLDFKMELCKDIQDYQADNNLDITPIQILMSMKMDQLLDILDSFK